MMYKIFLLCIIFVSIFMLIFGVIKIQQGDLYLGLFIVILNIYSIVMLTKELLNK